VFEEGKREEREFLLIYVYLDSQKRELAREGLSGDNLFGSVLWGFLP
jgi:hypothetical protein